MEIYTAFSIQKDKSQSKVILDEIKKWFISKKIMTSGS